VTQYLISLAQGANTSTPGPQAGGSSLSGMLVPMLLVFGVMYFLVIRPQSKKAKEMRMMLSQLKNGDQVVTTGGIIGKITGLKDDEITLLVSEGVRIRVQRSAVTGRLSTSSETPKSETK
jgi:preprotein translocase subunit YajC